jgi:UDP-glucose 4-epimerase
VVFASSGAVLAGGTPPLAEDQVPKPLAPYGASKLYGEAALQAFGIAYGITGVTLRFSNVYGPYSSHKRSVVAAFLRDAVQGRTLVIYGSGRQTRDFLHVDDVTAAIRAALEARAGGVFQLGTGVETSINRLARLVAAAAGAPLEIERRPARSAEAQRNYADISKARRVLRFRPKIDLATGLSKTLEWMRRSENVRSVRRSDA